jgi:hypothetical protein
MALPYKLLTLKKIALSSVLPHEKKKQADSLNVENFGAHFSVFQVGVSLDVPLGNDADAASESAINKIVNFRVADQFELNAGHF